MQRSSFNLSKFDYFFFYTVDIFGGKTQSLLANFVGPQMTGIVLQTDMSRISRSNDYPSRNCSLMLLNPFRPECPSQRCSCLEHRPPHRRYRGPKRQLEFYLWCAFNRCPDCDKFRGLLYRLESATGLIVSCQYEMLDICSIVCFDVFQVQVAKLCSLNLINIVSVSAFVWGALLNISYLRNKDYFPKFPAWLWKLVPFCAVIVFSERLCITIG